jgi:enamine deaminase RidA (YjgF/YER057c/UK114 family)
LGISADDQVPEDVEAQAVLCFEAIGACLAEARMSFADVVRINAYVTDRAHMAAYMAVRDRYVMQPPPASTLVIVSGFTRPEFKVEVEAVAATLADA